MPISVLSLISVIAVLSWQIHTAACNPLSNRHENQLWKHQWTVGQPVKTSSGTVIGHQAKNKTGVSEYLGIPYAKPPTGNLRWAPPVKYTGTGTINGSSYVCGSNPFPSFHRSNILSPCMFVNMIGYFDLKF
jgi:hypothetical protein